MVGCLDIARYFIRRSYQDNLEADMTNMKVQKLLYYAQSLHLALYDEPLFDNEIQAWRYGPVCPPAYSFYCEFEAKQLPIPETDDVALVPQETLKLLEEVWEYFGEHHAYYLSGMTHLEFPWKNARKNLPSQASSTNPILVEDMRLLGEEKLLEIERNHPAHNPLVVQALKEAFESTEPQRIIQREEIDGWLESLLA